MVDGTFNDDGDKDGLFTEYHDNGKVARKITFVNGLRHGVVQIYDEDGKPFESPSAVFIYGEDTSELNETRLARLRNEKVGFVFQFHYLLKEFTAQENVALPMFKLGKLSKSAALERAACRVFAEAEGAVPGRLLGESWRAGERPRQGARASAREARPHRFPALHQRPRVRGSADEG